MPSLLLLVQNLPRFQTCEKLRDTLFCFYAEFQLVHLAPFLDSFIGHVQVRQLVYLLDGYLQNLAPEVREAVV